MKGYFRRLKKNWEQIVRIVLWCFRLKYPYPPFLLSGPMNFNHNFTFALMLRCLAQQFTWAVS